MSAGRYAYEYQRTSDYMNLGGALQHMAEGQAQLAIGLRQTFALLEEVKALLERAKAR